MSNNSIASKILKSSIWQYLGSWLDKLIGFISTIVLARILVPDDFGIVAAASIITGLFHVIGSVGTEQYLIRKKEVSESELNTGWTINIIIKSISAILIFVLAETISNYMSDERLTIVLQVLSVSFLLAGFNNIGMVLYEKEYKYRPLFIIGLVSRLGGFFVKVLLALYLNNYWAFIYAQIFEIIISFIGSFIAHPYRPKFSLSNWKQQWLFSQWIILKSIFVFIRFRVDRILLSKFLPLNSLGLYSVSMDLATLPAGQIIGPIMQPLYVGLSEISHDKVKLADKVHKALSMLFIIVFPVSFGIYVTADNLVYVMLGEKWKNAIPLVSVVAFVLIPGVLGDFFTRVMTAMGKVKLIFQLEFLLGLLTISIFIFLAPKMAVLDFSMLRLVLTGINTCIVLIVLSFISSLSFIRICALTFLPFLSAIAMLYAITLCTPLISQYSYLMKLAFQVGFGAMIYMYLMSSFVYLLRNNINEYQFIWKTFYLSVFCKNKLLQ